MKRLIATTLVAFGLAFAAPAFAQQTGTTSGPAAGKNVEPSTVIPRLIDKPKKWVARGRFMDSSLRHDSRGLPFA